MKYKIEQVKIWDLVMKKNSTTILILPLIQEGGSGQWKNGH